MTVAAIALLGASAASISQTNPDKDRYRVRYPVDGPVPNYLAMRGFGGMAAESPDYAVGVVKEELRYTDSQAAGLVEEIGGVYKTLESVDEPAAAAKIACQADSNTSDQEAYRLMDLIDDAYIALYQELYARALTYVEEGTVQPILDRIGSGMSWSFIYAKALYEGGPAGLIQQHLAEICKKGSGCNWCGRSRGRGATL
jgi:hypothetical protein